MNNTTAIRVLLVDDHALFREGIVSLLAEDSRFEVVGEAASGEQAIELIPRLRPDLILMDIQMPGMGGLEATRSLLAEHAALKVVMLTVSEREKDLFAAIKAGAQGYLIKTVISGNEMRDSLLRVAAGGVIIPTEMAPRLLAEFAMLSKIKEEEKPAPQPVNQPRAESSAQRFDLLTKREIETLELVADGLSNKEIAARLYISENTVRAHLRAIMDKLHTSSRVQAAVWLRKQSD